MKLLFILFAITLLSASEIPYGGYRTFEEFSAKEPTIPSTWTMKSYTPDGADRGRYVEMIYVDSATGLERKFRRVKDGKIWAYVDSTGFFINHRGIFATAELSGDLAWFYAVEEMVADDFNSGIEGYQWHEDLLILNLKKNKRNYLSPRRVDKIIKTNKELAKEYKEEKHRRSTMKEYLDRFFENDK